MQPVNSLRNFPCAAPAPRTGASPPPGWLCLGLVTPCPPTARGYAPAATEVRPAPNRSNPAVKLRFLGAARKVTGSCFLVETAQVRFRLDCGLIQGSARRPFGFDPGSIDFMLLTRARRLQRPGPRERGHGRPAGRDAADNAQAEARCEAAYAHAGAAVLPLYTEQNAQARLAQVHGVACDRELARHPSVRCRFRDAGHILGSAIIEVWVTERGHTVKLVFTCDLAQPGRSILREPTSIEEAYILVMESTYCDRRPPDQAGIEAAMVAIVERTVSERSGNVIVPAFAVGRTQEVLHHLQRLNRARRLRQPRIFVNSPWRPRPRTSPGRTSNCSTRRLGTSPASMPSATASNPTCASVPVSRNRWR